MGLLALSVLAVVIVVLACCKSYGREDSTHEGMYIFFKWTAKFHANISHHKYYISLF